MESSEDRFRRKDKRGRRRTGKGSEGGRKGEEQKSKLAPNENSAGGAQQADPSFPFIQTSPPLPPYPLRYAIPLPHLLLAVCGALTSLCHLL